MLDMIEWCEQERSQRSRSIRSEILLVMQDDGPPVNALPEHGARVIPILIPAEGLSVAPVAEIVVPAQLRQRCEAGARAVANVCRSRRKCWECNDGPDVPLASWPPSRNDWH